MTTMTWTTPTIATDLPVTAGTHASRGLKKLGSFVAVFFGATADEDSGYRGLDLNGNAVWATPAQR